jgi:hypothetical protein
MSTLLIVLYDEAAIQHAFTRAFRDEGVDLLFVLPEPMRLLTSSHASGPMLFSYSIKLPDASGLGDVPATQGHRCSRTHHPHHWPWHQ